MDVLFLLVLTAIFCGWGIWVSGRGEGKGRRHDDGTADSGSKTP